jgi:hypothetical protein
MITAELLGQSPQMGGDNISNAGGTCQPPCAHVVWSFHAYVSPKTVVHNLPPQLLSGCQQHWLGRVGSLTLPWITACRGTCCTREGVRSITTCTVKLSKDVIKPVVCGMSVCCPLGQEQVVPGSHVHRLILPHILKH